LCQLYWGEDFEFQINKNILVDIHNYNNVTFCHDHRNKLKRYANEIILTKLTGMPGWFTIKNAQ